MKISKLGCIALFIGLVLGMATVVGGAPTDAIDYFGQKPPTDSALVFAPGVISQTNRRVTKTVFSPDGNECLIGIGESGRFKILYSTNRRGNWSTPVPAYFVDVPFAIEPFYSPDKQKIFFVGYVDNYLAADIYVCKRVGQSWAKPEKLDPPVNSSAEEYHPTAAANGTLYFYSKRDDPKSYIYRSKCENGKYPAVERLDIPTPYGAWDPFVAPDESYIIFTSIYPDGFGNEDQYITYWKNGRWTNPKNLGPGINTPKIEYGSVVSPDGKYYFFSRVEGWGPKFPADVYWIKADFIDALRKTNFVPYQKVKMPDQAGIAGQPIHFQVPRGSFIDDDGDDTLAYEARLADGNPLPSWLAFDRTTLAFSGVPPAEMTLVIRITAMDAAKAGVAGDFKVVVGKARG